MRSVLTHEDPLIVPLLPTGEGATPRPTTLKLSARQAIGLRAEGPGAARIRLMMRREGLWTTYFPPPPNSTQDLEVGLVALPIQGPREFILRGGTWQRPGLIAPVLLTSSLDPASDVFVVRNRMSKKFTEELAALLPHCAGKPRLHTIEISDDSSDLWMQDTIEFGVSATPPKRGRAKQTVSALLGLRGKHDMGLSCEALDLEVAKYLSRTLPEAATVKIGEPLAKRRWIDWYGNLEVTPPVPGYPFGRILTGEQNGLQIHPDLLRFLQAQKLQWPPLFLDVSWLTIGHVDELINFVPSSSAPGFRVLLPSPQEAIALLEPLESRGLGNILVFAGTKKETTVTRLLKEVARTPETQAIEESLRKTRKRLENEFGWIDDHIIDMPVLFQEGLPVIPNSVNSLVLDRDVLIPAPLGPVVEGKDIIAKSIQARFASHGIRSHFLNIWEPYHVRSGEIHCGTNAIRRLRNVDWWKSEG